MKNLGNTIKSGFENTIEHPIEDIGNQIKSGFQDNIINPIQQKIVDPIQQQISSLPQTTQNIINKLPSSITNSPQFQQTLDYITKKQGGLASSLLHNGVPALTGALGGAAGTLLAPELGPVGGIAGSTLGSYAGKELSDQIGNKYGVGLHKKKIKGGYISKEDAHQAIVDSMTNDKWGKARREEGQGIRKKKKHYYYSSDSSSDDERPTDSALGQLLKAHRRKEEKELKKGELDITRHLHQELMALRHGQPLKHVQSHPVGVGVRKRGRPKGCGLNEGTENRKPVVPTNYIGCGFKKGSKEAKEHMARIRAMRHTKGTPSLTRLGHEDYEAHKGTKSKTMKNHYDYEGGRGLYP